MGRGSAVTHITALSMHSTMNGPLELPRTICGAGDSAASRTLVWVKEHRSEVTLCKRCEKSAGRLLR